MKMTDQFTSLQTLWNYLYIEHPLQPADCIIGFGSHDVTIATRSAELYKAGWAPRILFTGYLGKGTLGVFPKAEAELFADLAMGSGVPGDAILIENKATNSGENIQFAKAMLKEREIPVHRIIAVHKPYMTRRVWASLRKQWPEAEVIVAPGNPSLEEYLQCQLAGGVPEEEIISSLVGDFQRMDAFARRGYQIPQDIPEDALAAYHMLVNMGYDKYIV